MDIKEKFEDFIAQYPIFEYRLLDTADIKVQERVWQHLGLSPGSRRTSGM